MFDAALSRLVSVLGVLVLVLVAYGLYQRGEARTARADLSATQVSLEAEIVTTERLRASIAAREVSDATRAAARTTTTIKTEAKAREVKRALKENPDWSRAPVPDAVFDSLFHDVPEGP